MAEQRIYFVDEIQQQTEKDELTVQRILEKAGQRVDAAAAQEGLLFELKGDERIPHNDLNERIRIEKDARFSTVAAAATKPAEEGPAQEGSSPESASTPDLGPSGMPVTAKPGEEKENQEKSSS